MKKEAGIIFKEYLQEALNHFTVCFDIRIAFYDTAGNEMKVGMRKKSCPCCMLIREDMRLIQRCLECDKYWMKKASSCGKMVSYHCHAGLMEAVKPVYVNDLLIGYIMIGQFRDSENLSAAVIKIAEKKINILKKAFHEVPYFPNYKVRHVLGMFEILVDSTMENNAYILEIETGLIKLKTFMNNNLHRKLSVKEAAKHMNWSISKLSQFIKKQTGKSFKELQIEMKLEAAEKLLISGNGMTVYEAGMKVGFDDPCYFSRIYRKYRGKPPMKFLKEKR